MMSAYDVCILFIHDICTLFIHDICILFIHDICILFIHDICTLFIHDICTLFIHDSCILFILHSRVTWHCSIPIHCSVCVCDCVCACVHVCMCACVCVHVCTCVHIQKRLSVTSLKSENFFLQKKKKNFEFSTSSPKISFLFKQDKLRSQQDRWGYTTLLPGTSYLLNFIQGEHLARRVLQGLDNSPWGKRNQMSD